MSSLQTIETPQDYVNYTFNLSARGVTEVGAELAGLSNTVSNLLGLMAFKTSEYLTHTESLILGVGAAATATFASATQNALRFEQAVANVQAIGGESINAGLIGEKAMEYSNKFGMNVDSMTEGLEALARAGLTATNVMSGVLEEGVKLSKLEGLDLEDAINDLISTTNLLSENEIDINTQEYADAVKTMNQHIVSTSESAPINAQNIMQTLQHVGGYASANKIDQEDLFAVIAQLGAKGTKGEMAGTALRAFIAAGQKDQAQRALARIGLKASDLWDDSGEAMLPVSEMKDVLDEALEARGYSKQEKLEFYSDFAGYKQANQIMKINTSEVQKYKENIANAWDLGTKLNTILGTVNSNLQIIFQTSKNFMTKVGQSALPILNAMLIPIRLGVELINKIPLADKFTGIALGFLAFKGVLLLINRVVPAIVTLMKRLDTTEERARGISGYVRNIKEDIIEAIGTLKMVKNKDWESLTKKRLEGEQSGKIDDDVIHKMVVTKLIPGFKTFSRDKQQVLLNHSVLWRQTPLYEQYFNEIQDEQQVMLNSVLDALKEGDTERVEEVINVNVNNDNQEEENDNRSRNRRDRENNRNNVGAGPEQAQREQRRIDAEFHSILSVLENREQIDFASAILRTKDSLAESIGRAVARALNLKSVEITKSLGRFQVDSVRQPAILRELQDMELQANVELGDVRFLFDDIDEMEVALRKGEASLQNYIKAFSNINLNHMNWNQVQTAKKILSREPMRPEGRKQSIIQNATDIRNVLTTGRWNNQGDNSPLGIRDDQIREIERILGITNARGGRTVRLERAFNEIQTRNEAEREQLLEDIRVATTRKWEKHLDELDSENRPSAFASRHLTDEKANYIGRELNLEGFNTVEGSAEKLLDYFQHNDNAEQLNDAARLLAQMMQHDSANIFNAKETETMIHQMRTILQLKKAIKMAKGESILDDDGEPIFHSLRSESLTNYTHDPIVSERVWSNIKKNSNYNMYADPSIEFNQDRLDDFFNNGLLLANNMKYMGSMGETDGTSLIISLADVLDEARTEDKKYGELLFGTFVHELSHITLQHRARQQLTNSPYAIQKTFARDQDNGVGGGYFSHLIEEYEAMLVEDHMMTMLGLQGTHSQHVIDIGAELRAQGIDTSFSENIAAEMAKTMINNIDTIIGTISNLESFNENKIHSGAFGSWEEAKTKIINSIAEQESAYGSNIHGDADNIMNTPIFERLYVTPGNLEVSEDVPFEGGALPLPEQAEDRLYNFLRAKDVIEVTDETRLMGMVGTGENLVVNPHGSIEFNVTNMADNVAEQFMAYFWHELMHIVNLQPIRVDNLADVLNYEYDTNIKTLTRNSDREYPDGGFGYAEHFPYEIESHLGQTGLMSAFGFYPGTLAYSRILGMSHQTVKYSDVEDIDMDLILTLMNEIASNPVAVMEKITNFMHSKDVLSLFEDDDYDLRQFFEEWDTFYRYMNEVHIKWSEAYNNAESSLVKVSNKEGQALRNFPMITPEIAPQTAYNLLQQELIKRRYINDNDYNYEPIFDINDKFKFLTYNAIMTGQTDLLRQYMGEEEYQRMEKILLDVIDNNFMNVQFEGKTEPASHVSFPYKGSKTLEEVFARFDLDESDAGKKAMQSYLYHNIIDHFNLETEPFATDNLNNLFAIRMLGAASGIPLRPIFEDDEGVFHSNRIQTAIDRIESEIKSIELYKKYIAKRNIILLELWREYQRDEQGYGSFDARDLSTYKYHPFFLNKGKEYLNKLDSRNRFRIEDLFDENGQYIIDSRKHKGKGYIDTDMIVKPPFKSLRSSAITSNKDRKILTNYDLRESTKEMIENTNPKSYKIDSTKRKNKGKLQRQDLAKQNELNWDEEREFYDAFIYPHGTQISAYGRGLDIKRTDSYKRHLNKFSQKYGLSHLSLKQQEEQYFNFIKTAHEVINDSMKKYGVPLSMDTLFFRGGRIPDVNENGIGFFDGITSATYNQAIAVFDYVQKSKNRALLKLFTPKDVHSFMGAGDIIGKANAFDLYPVEQERTFGHRQAFLQMRDPYYIKINGSIRKAVDLLLLNDKNINTLKKKAKEADTFHSNRAKRIDYGKRYYSEHENSINRVRNTGINFLTRDANEIQEVLSNFNIEDYAFETKLESEEGTQKEQKKVQMQLNVPSYQKTDLADFAAYYGFDVANLERYGEIFEPTPNILQFIFKSDAKSFLKEELHNQFGEEDTHDFIAELKDLWKQGYDWNGAIYHNSYPEIGYFLEDEYHEFIEAISDSMFDMISASRGLYKPQRLFRGGRLPFSPNDVNAMGEFLGTTSLSYKGDIGQVYYRKNPNSRTFMEIFANEGVQGIIPFSDFIGSNQYELLYDNQQEYAIGSGQVAIGYPERKFLDDYSLNKHHVPILLPSPKEMDKIEKEARDVAEDNGVTFQSKRNPQNLVYDVNTDFLSKDSSVIAEAIANFSIDDYPKETKDEFKAQYMHELIDSQIPFLKMADMERAKKGGLGFTPLISDHIAWAGFDVANFERFGYNIGKNGYPAFQSILMYVKEELDAYDEKLADFNESILMTLEDVIYDFDYGDITTWEDFDMIFDTYYTYEIMQEIENMYREYLATISYHIHKYMNLDENIGMLENYRTYRGGRKPTTNGVGKFLGSTSTSFIEEMGLHYKARFNRDNVSVIFNQEGVKGLFPYPATILTGYSAMDAQARAIMENQLEWIMANGQVVVEIPVPNDEPNMDSALLALTPKQMLDAKKEADDAMEDTFKSKRSKKTTSKKAYKENLIKFLETHQTFRNTPQGMLNKILPEDQFFSDEELRNFYAKYHDIIDVTSSSKLNVQQKGKHDSIFFNDKVTEELLNEAIKNVTGSDFSSKVMSPDGTVSIAGGDDIEPILDELIRLLNIKTKNKKKAKKKTTTILDDFVNNDPIEKEKEKINKEHETLKDQARRRSHVKKEQYKERLRHEKEKEKIEEQLEALKERARGHRYTKREKYKKQLEEQEKENAKRKREQDKIIKESIENAQNNQYNHVIGNNVVHQQNKTKRERQEENLKTAETLWGGQVIAERERQAAEDRIIKEAQTLYNRNFYNEADAFGQARANIRNNGGNKYLLKGVDIYEQLYKFTNKQSNNLFDALIDKTSIEDKGSNIYGSASELLNKNTKSLKSFTEALESLSGIVPLLTPVILGLNKTLDIIKATTTTLDAISAFRLVTLNKEKAAEQLNELATKGNTLAKHLNTIATWKNSESEIKKKIYQLTSNVVGGFSEGITTLIEGIFVTGELIAPLLAIAGIVAVIAAAIVGLNYWQKKHAEALKQSQEELKESTAKNNAALSQYQSLKQLRESETDSIKKQQKARKEAIALYELEAARLDKQKKIKKESDLRNHRLWGEYGLRAEYQKMGWIQAFLRDPLFGVIAKWKSGEFESQYEKYDGLTKNIRKVKEDTLGKVFMSSNERKVSSYYDKNQLFFSAIEAYADPLQQLYDKESALIERYGDIDLARSSQEFADAVQEFSDATGLNGETAGKMLDWLETENRVNQAVQVAKAQIGMVRARADAAVMGIDVGTPEGMDDVGKAMVYSQIDQMIKDEKREMWWSMLWEYLKAIISALLPWKWGEVGGHLKKATAYQQGIWELEGNRQKYYDDAIEYYENADRRDYGTDTYGINSDAPFERALDSIDEQKYLEQQAYMSEDKIFKASQSNGQAAVRGFKDGLNQHSPGDIAMAMAAELKFVEHFITIFPLKIFGRLAQRQADEYQNNLDMGLFDENGVPLTLSQKSLYGKSHNTLRYDTIINKLNHKMSYGDLEEDGEGVVTPKRKTNPLAKIQKEILFYNRKLFHQTEDIHRDIKDPSTWYAAGHNNGDNSVSARAKNALLYDKGLGLPSGVDPNDPLVQEELARRRRETATRTGAHGIAGYFNGRIPGVKGAIKTGMRTLGHILNPEEAAPTFLNKIFKNGADDIIDINGYVVDDAVESGAKNTDDILKLGSKNLDNAGEAVAKGGRKSIPIIGGDAVEETFLKVNVRKSSETAGKTVTKGGSKDAGKLAKGSGTSGKIAGKSADKAGSELVAKGTGKTAGKKGGELVTKGAGKAAGETAGKAGGKGVAKAAGKTLAKAAPFVGPGVTAAFSIAEHNPFEKHYNEDGSEKRAFQSTGEVVGEVGGAVAAAGIGLLVGGALEAASLGALTPFIPFIVGGVEMAASLVLEPVGKAVGGLIGWAGDELFNGALNAASGLMNWIFGEDEQENNAEAMTGNINEGTFNDFQDSIPDIPTSSEPIVGDSIQQNNASINQPQNNIIIKNININTEDDPEKIKSALMNLIIEMQEQINPRQVSRTIGEPPATTAATTNQNENNTTTAEGTDPQSGTPNGNSNTNPTT